MAEFDEPSFKSEFYLNPNEQDLLLTALNSNKPTGSTIGLYNSTANRSNSHNATKSTQSNMASTYTSPAQQTPGSATLTNKGFDNSPFGDFELDDSNFDWDVNGELIGALPGTTTRQEDHEENELGDKRKSPEDAEEEDGGGKRREGEDKTGKKPGRKPLTSEPTTVSVLALAFPCSLFLIHFIRNVKPRTGLHREHFEKGRRNTSRISRTKSMNLRRHRMLLTTRTVY